MMGDDHSRIAAASKLAAQQIGCKVFKGSPYYRKEGMHPLDLLKVLNDFFVSVLAVPAHAVYECINLPCLSFANSLTALLTVTCVSSSALVYNMQTCLE